MTLLWSKIFRLHDDPLVENFPAADLFVDAVSILRRGKDKAKCIHNMCKTISFTTLTDTPIFF